MMLEKMKKSIFIINVILVLAVAVLFVIVLNDDKNSTIVEDKSSNEELKDHGIVYINIDSLIINYEYARKLSEDLLRKEESSRADFNERARVFQQDMMEFQRKLQNNGFLSLERAQNEENRLREKEMELQELNNRLSNELMQQQERMNQELRDTITLFLDSYCREKSHRLVLSNTLGDNILYAEPMFDITTDVVRLLNIRYAEAR